MNRRGRPIAFIDRLRAWHVQDELKRAEKITQSYRSTFGKDPEGLSLDQCERILRNREEAKQRQEAYTSYQAVFGHAPRNLTPAQVIRVVTNREAALRNREILAAQSTNESIKIASTLYTDAPQTSAVADKDPFEQKKNNAKQVQSVLSDDSKPEDTPDGPCTDGNTESRDSKTVDCVSMEDTSDINTGENLHVSPTEDNATFGSAILEDCMSEVQSEGGSVLICDADKSSEHEEPHTKRRREAAEFSIVGDKTQRAPETCGTADEPDTVV